jgi:hypothetical protein
MNKSSLFSISLYEFNNSFDQSMLQSFFNFQFAPFVLGLLFDRRSIASSFCGFLLFLSDSSVFNEPFDVEVVITLVKRDFV